MNIVTIGPAGTFSHEAAKTLFSDAEITLVNNFEEVFAIANTGEMLGFVPFENSQHGSVFEVLDLLVETEVQVWRTHDISIHHALGAQGGHEIQRIASHSQALAQCRHFLKDNYPHVERFPVSSTAYAINIAVEDPSVAAIAARSVIEERGLSVIADNLADDGNTTRFAVIGKTDPYPTVEKTQMGIVFHPLGDFPGLLHHVLTPFKIYDINLTLIENRPTGKGFGDYLFHLHFEGNSNNARVQQAIKELEDGKKVEVLKHLGEWYTA